MPNVELWIEDYQIELQGDEIIATDYAIAEIGNFATRRAFKSVSFSVPLTANNKRVLENPDQVNNLSTRPYRRLKARVYQDGIDQQIRFADIESVTDVINLRLYGGNASFFEIIKNQFIADISTLDETNHVWNLTNVVASRTNTTEYIYPLIDYHADSPNAIIDNTTREIDVRYMYFSFFYEYLLEKICEENGYTLTNNISTQIDYDNTYLILPVISGEYDKKIQERFAVNAATTSNETSTPVSIGIANPQAVFLDFVETSDIDDVLVTDTETFTILGGSPITETLKYYECRITGTYTINTTATIQYIGGGVTGSIIIYKLVGGVATALAAQNVTLPVSLVQTTQYFDLSFTAELEQDDKLFILLATTAAQTFTALSGATLEVAVESGTFNFGETIYTRYCFSNYKVSDIFKYYLQFYCGVITVNEETQTITLNKFDKIVDNIANSIDWSDKIDFTDKAQIEYSFLNYGQSNNLLYADDDSVIKPIGTDGVIEVDDETLEAENELFTTFVSASNIVLRLDGIEVPHLKILTTESGITEETEDIEKRILLHEKVDAADLSPTTSLTYTNGTNTSVQSTDLPLAWFIKNNATNNLGFANNGITLHWQGLIDVLDRTKIVTANVRLNAVDINALDFLIPVYIQAYNSFFYISKIKNYEYGSTQSTQVELVKLR